MDRHEWAVQFSNAVENIDSVSVQTSPDLIDQGVESIRVQFQDEMNTHRVVNAVPEELQDVRVSVDAYNDDIIRFEHEPEIGSEPLEAEALIKQILDDDIPVRNGYQPEYSFHRDSIIVKTPEKASFTLVPKVHTRIWKQANVYYSDGVFIHQYQQCSPTLPNQGPMKDEDDPIKAYGRLRINHFSHTLDAPCPACESGTISYGRVDNHDGYLSAWVCDSCNRHGPLTKQTEAFDGINPVWSRSKILAELRNRALNTAHSSSFTHSQ